jgi:hypothetical protein
MSTPRTKPGSTSRAGKGFDPADASIDLFTPQGVGNVAAAAVGAYRHHDGANQFDDEVGSNGVPYSDYTYYAPVNTAEKVNDPNGFLTPHWYRLKPFALDRSDQFRPPAPPRVDSERLRKETDENIALNE